MEQKSRAVRVSVFFFFLVLLLHCFLMADKRILFPFGMFGICSRYRCESSSIFSMEWGQILMVFGMQIGSVGFRRMN